jgi:hypothetical protein
MRYAWPVLGVDTPCCYSQPEIAGREYLPTYCRVLSG